MSSFSINSRKKLLISVFMLVILLMVWFSVRQFKQYMAPVNPFDRTLVEVHIPDNTSTHQVSRMLAEQDLIRNREFFVWYCRLRGYDARLKAGLYQFRRSQPMSEIVDDLVAGRVASMKITIPEGYTLKQMGELFAAKGICTAEEWDKAVVRSRDFAFLRDIPMRENRLEGFLYPDTYRIRRDTSIDQIIDMMLKRFSEVWEKEFAALARQKGVSVYQVVTVASMIEKEALFDSERPRIAGVIYNRLQDGMPLQVDATVLYSLGHHKDQVTLRDLEVDSPYNTYRNTGLPPGPIASPGLTSISAALQPEEHDYYYYVATSDGHHVFSRTYAEHLKAKNQN
ncbi:MAG: endolytic transglycosylase MltG [Bacillota bacterium]